MSEQAVFKDGHWEIAPEVRGDHVPLPYQRMNPAERDRIIAQRWRYIAFVQDHFADETLPPPHGAVEIESGHGHH